MIKLGQFITFYSVKSVMLEYYQNNCQIKKKYENTQVVKYSKTDFSIQYLFNYTVLNYYWYFFQTKINVIFFFI